MLSRRHTLSFALATLPLATLSSAARAATPVKVMVSFSILADLVQQIAGRRLHASMLVGPDQDTHVYQPKPSDLRAVAAAELGQMAGAASGMDQGRPVALV